MIRSLLIKTKSLNVRSTQQIFKSVPKLNFCSEIEKSKQAATSKRPDVTIFDKIISKEIPADIIFEDKNFLAFNDVNPQAPVHFLVIPKRRIARFQDATVADKELIGDLMLVAAKLASERLPQGFRVVINNGLHGCQSVYHLHIHVLGGRQLTWPPG